jgi:ATP-dependent Clp protease ATP-binding subunit ClpA
MDDYKRIAALMLDEFKTPLNNRGIIFGYDDSALTFIAKGSFGHKAGARDIRHYIRREVEDPLSLMLMQTEKAPPALISLTVQGEKLSLITA